MWSVVRIPVSPHTFGAGRVWVMDLVWFAITPHVPVLSPACKLLPSKESSGVLGDGVIPFRGRKIYMYALTKPHGSCRGSSGSDMHKQSKTITET